MYDSFDMACHDDTSALQLNIKVNSENLLPTTQKYNVGSLRLPADPSWPKIPQRRLADDVGDTEPPYIVTLTGTPRRSRTVVKTSHSQSTRIATAKETMNVPFHRQKIQLPVTHPLKRRPGCTDPRFKRVTSVKSQVTSTDPLERELDKPAEMSRSALIIPTQSKAISEKIEKTVPEKDTNIPQVTQQEAEKPGEIRGTESIGIQTVRAVKTKDTENTMVQSGTEVIMEHSLYRSGDVGSLGKSSPKTNCSPEGTRQKSIEPDTLHPEYYSPTESPKNHSDVLMSACKNKDAEQTKCVTIISENKSVSNIKGLPNVPMNMQSQATPLQYCQGSNDQFFFMVEKKVQSSPIDIRKIDSVCKSHCQCTAQCYNVQVPVLSYQNVPVRISARTQAEVDIPPQSKLDAQKQYVQYNLQPEHDQSQEKERCFPEPNKDFVDVRQKADVLNTTDRNQCVAPQKRVLDANRPDTLSHINCQRTEGAQLYLTNVLRKDAQVQNQLLETTDSGFYAPEKMQEYTCSNQQRKVKDDTIYRRQEVTDSKCYVQENMNGQIKLNDAELTLSKKQILPKREVYFAQCEHNLDSLEGKHETLKTQKEGNITSCRLKRKIKSNQYLPYLEARCIRKYTRSSEPHITVGRKKGAIPYLRKANSYFSKYTYPLRVDSNKTLAWSGCQRSRRRYSLRHSQKVTGNKKEVLQNSQKKVQSTNDPRKKNDQTNNKSFGTDVPIEKPTEIPIKTQQLLNRSYWEYYNKLRLHKVDNSENAQQQYFCQVAMGAPRIKKRRAEELNGQNCRDNLELSLPEIRTLEQCSVLSSMINKTLDSALQPSSDTMQTKQLYLNGNMKSSSDPTAGTQSAVMQKIALKGQRDLYQESILCSTFLNKHKHKREKHVDKRLLKLRTIGEHSMVFFGCTMYAMIVLLPMIYDYFFYEEYDDYDDLNYIELTLDYIVSSFREAFGGFFNVIDKIFFRPRACRKCNNIA